MIIVQITTDGKNGKEKEKCNKIECARTPRFDSYIWCDLKGWTFFTNINSNYEPFSGISTFLL